jgi:hypothetical protein
MVSGATPPPGSRMEQTSLEALKAKRAILL